VGAQWRRANASPWFNGADLPVTATHWSCVRDNHTGLIWEVKTDDGGLRDKNHTYTWYNPHSSTNGGFAGTATGTGCNNTLSNGCNTHAFVQAVNVQGLCGANDWRLPDRFELSSIVSRHRNRPAIDTDFFPNTDFFANNRSSSFWSASPYAGGSEFSSWGWSVNFHAGNVGTHSKSINHAVRVVRGGH